MYFIAIFNSDIILAPATTRTAIAHPLLKLGGGYQTQLLCIKDGVGSIDALEIDIEYPPEAWLERSVNGGSWSSSNAGLHPGQQVRLRWGSSRAESCEGSGPGFSTGSGDPTSGTDWYITEPNIGEEQTYTVTCDDGRGRTDSDSITLTRPMIVTLQRSIDNGSWSGSNATISAGQQVRLKWSSVNAAACTGSGAGFSTGSGDPTSGTDSTITEPSIGNSTTYRVTCTAGSDTRYDSLTINHPTPAPTATLERNIDGGSSVSYTHLTLPTIYSV